MSVSESDPVSAMASWCRAVLCLVATLTTACAGTRLPVYVAPSHQTIQASAEMTFGGDGTEISVLNGSSVAIVVTGLELYDCENIKNRCEVQRLQVRVPPHQRVSLATVRQNDKTRRWSFNYRYSWEPARDQ